MSVAYALGHTHFSSEKCVTRDPATTPSLGVTNSSCPSRLPPAVARSTVRFGTVESADFGRIERCPWCGQPIRKHGLEALARCEAAFRTELDRRMAGPARVRKVEGRSP